jgi:hypothetical protein
MERKNTFSSSLKGRLDSESLRLLRRHSLGSIPFSAKLTSIAEDTWSSSVAVAPSKLNHAHCQRANDAVETAEVKRRSISCDFLHHSVLSRPKIVSRGRRSRSRASTRLSFHAVVPTHSHSHNHSQCHSQASDGSESELPHHAIDPRHPVHSDPVNHDVGDPVSAGDPASTSGDSANPCPADSTDTERCLIGILTTDRDAELLPLTLQHMHKAIAFLHKNRMPSQPKMYVDLIVTTRACDEKCREVLKKERQKQVTVSQETIRNMTVELVQYGAQFSVEQQFHTSDVLDAITMQRNHIRQYAITHNYTYLFFLDSDVYLNPNTLHLLLASQRRCIGAAYMPRWSKHVVLGVGCGRTEDDECTLQLLVNPHLIMRTSGYKYSRTDSNGRHQQVVVEPESKGKLVSFPCSTMGFGALLIHKSLLHVAYQVQLSIGGVKGEDIGFCADLVRTGNPENFPHMLARHVVEHASGGARRRAFVPHINDTCPIISHVLFSQLLEVEHDMPIKWHAVERRRFGRNNTYSESFWKDIPAFLRGLAQPGTSAGIHSSAVDGHGQVTDPDAEPDICSLVVLEKLEDGVLPFQNFVANIVYDDSD